MSHADFSVSDLVLIDECGGDRRIRAGFEKALKQCAECGCAASQLIVFGMETGTPAIAGVFSDRSSDGSEARVRLTVSSFLVEVTAGCSRAIRLLAAVVARAAFWGADEVRICPGDLGTDIRHMLETYGFEQLGHGFSLDTHYALDLSGEVKGSVSHVNRLAYDALASEYRSRAMAPRGDEESVDVLGHALWDQVRLADPRILELGPGAGSMLEWFAARGARTVGVESSPTMASICAERSPNSLVIVADIGDVDFPTHCFDGIYAGAFLHLFPECQAQAVLKRVVGWLRPGGALFVNTSIGAEDRMGWDLKSDYGSPVVRFRSWWTEASFRELVEGAGLVIEERIETHQISRGKVWVAFVAVTRDIG